MVAQVPTAEGDDEGARDLHVVAREDPRPQGVDHVGVAEAAPGAERLLQHVLAAGAGEEGLGVEGAPRDDDPLEGQRRAAPAWCWTWPLDQIPLWV